MIRANQLDVDRAFVLVIDIQAKLLPFIHNQPQLVRATRELLDGTRVFELPVLATEQNPKGLGSTVPEIQSSLDVSQATMLEKSTMSCCGEPVVRQALDRIDRPQAILAGIEAHVCVQQTALDLRAMEYDVFVCADAVGSRSRLDYTTSLTRMSQEGAYITTVESVLFELCNRCGTERFKGLLEVIKAYPPDDG